MEVIAVRERLKIVNLKKGQAQPLLYPAVEGEGMGRSGLKDIA
jgi:hypothetical protein